MKTHLNHPPHIKGSTFKCGVGTYLLDQGHRDYRLYYVANGNPSKQVHKSAEEIDDIIACLASAEKMTIRAVEEAYHDLGMG